MNLKLTCAQFKKDFLSEIETLYSTSLSDTSTIGQFIALGQLVRRYNSQSWTRTAKFYRDHHQKQVYYFSIEFLPGRLLASNLLNLNLLTTVKKGLTELGLDFETISQAEPDPALGNGGLGRLAACYMDAMASLKIAGNGNGIRYRYGLFKQVFMDGYQVELPDDWLHHGNVWETRRDNKSCIVQFGGNVWLQPQADGSLQPQSENTEDVLAVPTTLVSSGITTILRTPCVCGPRSYHPVRPILRRISVIESVRLPRSCILTILTRPGNNCVYAKNTFSLLRVFKVSCVIFVRRTMASNC